MVAIATAALTVVTALTGTPARGHGQTASAPAEPASLHTETVLNHASGTPHALGKRLYFSSYDEKHGWELWRSDGTAEGTALFKDLRPGTASSRPASLTPAGDTLFFFAQVGSRSDLWRTDGTRAGTILLKKDTGTGTLNVDATAVGNQLLFFARGERGVALWRSDGTPGGTVMLKDRFFQAWDFHDPELNEMTVVGKTLYVVAKSEDSGPELWRSDGTRRGTRLVKDINPDRWADGPEELTTVGNFVYFTANDGTNGRELWRSDGTGAGTAMVEDIRDYVTPAGPTQLTAVGDRLYFVALDAVAGYELWSSDGTADGTSVVADTYPGPGTDTTYPNFLTAFNDVVVFTLTDETGDPELWRSDGSSAGTYPVTDINPGDCGEVCVGLRPFASVDDRLYLVVGREGENDELWTTAGTPGTESRIDRFSPVPRWDPALDAPITLGGTLFFAARDGLFVEQLLKVVDGAPATPTCHGLPSTISGSGTITGTAGDDVIVGGSGADVIDGRGGHDVVCGGDGNDTLLQGALRDGADMMDGQGGDDIVSYAARTTSVYIGLRDNHHPNDGASKEYDALTGVENAIGGRAGDQIEGDGGANILRGAGGNDKIDGDKGNDIARGGPGDDRLAQHAYEDGSDILDGQSGRDVADYGARQFAIRVTLGTGTLDDGAVDEGDTVIRIEDLLGGWGNDVLVGDQFSNRISGSYGDDTLTGGLGSDVLAGDVGSDVLDLRDGVSGNDRGDGGDQVDTATRDPRDVLLNVP